MEGFPKGGYPKNLNTSVCIRHLQRNIFTISTVGINLFFVLLLPHCLQIHVLFNLVSRFSFAQRATFSTIIVTKLIFWESFTTNIFDDMVNDFHDKSSHHLKWYQMKQNDLTGNKSSIKSSIKSTTVGFSWLLIFQVPTRTNIYTHWRFL